MFDLWASIAVITVVNLTQTIWIEDWSINVYQSGQLELFEHLVDVDNYTAQQRFFLKSDISFFKKLQG